MSIAGSFVARPPANWVIGAARAIRHRRGRAAGYRHIGAVVRYRIGVAVGLRSFPWASLSVNVIGSFALAVVLAGPGAARWSPTTTTTLAVGLLGSFTTFSTFGYETFTLLRTGREQLAFSYVALSLLGGLAAAGLGYLLGRALA